MKFPEFAVSSFLIFILLHAATGKPYNQSSREQYNILHYLAANGPYVDFSGFGIDSDVPFGCEVTQVQILMRHGERFPTIGAGKELCSLYKKLTSADISEYKGPLGFVKDWKYAFPEKDLEMESTVGVYAGLKRCHLEGERFNQKYGHLWGGKAKLPVFAAGQTRVVDSAKAFIRGFVGESRLFKAQVVVIPENSEQGANTLTSRAACVNADDSANEDYIARFDTSYLEREARRLNSLSPGYDLSAEDVASLVRSCAFELNVQGNSSICGVLSSDVYAGFSYQRDLYLYYNKGPGYNMSNALGSLFVNASIALLNQKDGVNSDGINGYEQKIFMSFSHDTDIISIASAFGLYEGQDSLPVDRIEFQRSFKVSDLVPMAGHLVLERLMCGKNEYVRIIMNESVYPLPWCQTGPGFSCPLELFTEHLQEMVDNNDYTKLCEQSKGPQKLTFFWDWETAGYRVIELGESMNEQLDSSFYWNALG
ncbi:unnamed protein product [Kuraishia capsulata CBS 1993]|uniref:Uncharacterized protein n=1 Tax=Kuraishia capsulata CBS 1993 TaxID=1382522 RepID=W6MH96_9ASCO|nr:uncharacterized protein KUCA_T00001564001 [Kuraishia capsulata CBS 1993]CDK25594.1 unnamed protein product [Kuraishia capsulata CBS 1993]